MTSDEQANHARGVSRRGLGRRVAALAAATLQPGSSAPAPPPTPQNRGGQPPLPAADQAEVEAHYANVIRKYGDRLSEEQRLRIRAAMVRHHRMLIRVRAFPLENGDSPATGLRLYPNDAASAPHDARKRPTVKS